MGRQTTEGRVRVWVTAALVVIGLVTGVMLIRRQSSHTQNDDLKIPDLDETVATLPIGYAMFHAPRTVQLHQTESANLVLSVSLSADDLGNRMPDSGDVTSDRSLIASQMEATLRGDGFEIRALTPEHQIVTTRHLAAWSWEIVANKPGKHTLHASLSANLGMDARLMVRKIERDIVVEQTVFEAVLAFVATNWQWLVVTLILPAGGTAFGWFKRRRAPAPTKPAGGVTASATSTNNGGHTSQGDEVAAPVVREPPAS